MFEANATMVVNPPEPDARWNYPRPAYERISAGIQKMRTDWAISSARSMAEAQPPSRVPVSSPSVHA